VIGQRAREFVPLLADSLATVYFVERYALGRSDAGK
jgi:hypothetical protein